MLLFQDYLQFDPKKKDISWMTRLISQMRLTSYKPLIEIDRARLNRLVVNSEQSMENIYKMFKDSREKLEKEGFAMFGGIAIFEEIKNILTAEKMKAEIKAYVDAKDPALQRLKDEDRNLLKNKKLIDGAVNNIQKSIGLPPKEIGNEQFNGNYADFSAMGFDTSQDMDIETFFETFYQLDTEIDFQKIINHVFASNSVEDYTADFLEDCMAVKCLAIQQYVNKMTGAITFRRLIPENIWRVVGETRVNQKSDVAVGYYDYITVSEFLKRAGDNFDFVAQLEWLLYGVNFMNSSLQLTGIIMPDQTILGDRKNVCTYAEVLNYKVSLGYIEFKSFDAVKYKEFQNQLGNTKVYEVNENEAMDKKYLEYADFKERTYSAYFLVTSSFEQYVFTGGLLYHQETEGHEDEYGNFSIKYIKNKGKTIAEVARPWIEVAQEGFAKFRYVLRKSKEDGTDYNLDSLMQVAKAFNNNQGDPATLKATLDMLKESADSIWAYPRDEEGTLIQVNGDLNREKINPFDSKIKSYKEIVDWAVQMIKADLGINALREGATPKTNATAKLEIASEELAQNTTYVDIDNMLDYIYRNSGISTLSFTMDIIRFKDSLPYKYLHEVIGEEGCARLSKLPKISPHRMDIYVTSASNVKERALVYRDTALAFQKGVIDYSTLMLINKVDDPRKAMKLLAIKEQKLLMQKQEEQQQIQQDAIAIQDKKTKDELMIINTRGQWEVKKAQVQTDGYIKAAQINASSKMGAKKIEGEQKMDEQHLEYQQDQRKALGVV